jgi:hypothetical protein
MVHVLRAATALALLALVSCSSGDPRLPQQLYEEAIQLNQAGRALEAKALMEKLASRFPDSAPGQQARKDLYLLDALLHQDLLDRQRLVHSGMKRVADALTRYKGKRGEYPRFLADLVPEYLEQTPETPWKHPYFYRPFVATPISEGRDRKGRTVQVFSSKLDAYHLVCLGVDLQPGGTDLAADTFVVNGEFVKIAYPPPITPPQPIR